MAEPSKVIHIRNVGHEIAEGDLVQLLQPFGTASNIVMLRAKNQALIQMQDIHSSVSALQYYSAVQPSVKVSQLSCNREGSCRSNTNDRCGHRQAARAQPAIEIDDTTTSATICWPHMHRERDEDGMPMYATADLPAASPHVSQIP